ncbi:uncharacterized protein M421DRAFT_56758 [Didymella exigua CBS 183.55]|uniref:Rhodopsin domain-containing protein n=1 Tax=Didymella exigua CBS 183.55 TaxID=1150837 RepID=A0A6A5RSF5_9PLEO|nr:uncharacterized protein M421DRAFT_56758 [Didymella exigua CBS 183.55]KAF1931325.1 hypothetical protein M421DRAFT_56758 [Didymella exigua CBS 183.55]
MPGGLHPPIEVILKWPAPNYVNPTTRPNTIFVIACVCGPVTFAMLMARLWVRIFHQRNPGWDDWLVVAGTIPTIAATCMLPIATNIGFNRHIWDIDFLKEPERGVTTRKYVLALLCIFCVASGLIKISILLFYRRLSSRVVSNRFRWAVWITIAFIASSTVAFTIVPIFGCDPISAFWDQANVVLVLKGYKYRCFNEGADVFSACVISTFQDLITAVLPTFLYWNLRIPVRQKIALFGIFAIGYGVAALGALRAYYSWQIYFGTYDSTWVTWNLFITTMLELHVGCFCANAPCLKVFFKYFFHEKLTSNAKRSEASGQKGQLSGTQSTKSSASMLREKVSHFFSSKSSSAHSRDGYLSEPHTDVSVDNHGGVQVQRQVCVTMSPPPAVGAQPTGRGLRESADTTDMICAQYYDDIELGRFTTDRNSHVSSHHSHGVLEDPDAEALPAMPQAARSPRSMRSFISFHRESRSPRALTHPEWPSWPLPTTIPEERHDDGQRPNLHPPRSASWTKPDWQTWT